MELQCLLIKGDNDSKADHATYHFHNTFDIADDNQEDHCNPAARMSSEFPYECDLRRYDIGEFGREVGGSAGCVCHFTADSERAVTAEVSSCRGRLSLRHPRLGLLLDDLPFREHLAW
jgi:hypothetical protein